MTPSSPSAIVHALAHEPLEVLGQLRAASNATALCTLPDGTACVYKPVRGERPLWDFPDGTLAGRELATAALAEALALDVVPPTVWREEGPFGPGMCQLWVEQDSQAALVDVIPVGALESLDRTAWREALRGEDESGRAVVLIHRDNVDLATIAILDAIVNNADRKGGHLLPTADGRVMAIDHGVTFHPEPKLRTVLWGWAGEQIGAEHGSLLSLLDAMRGSLPATVTTWLTPLEAHALEQRISEVTSSRRFPVPAGSWPAIPWPVH